MYEITHLIKFINLYQNLLNSLCWRRLGDFYLWFVMFWFIGILHLHSLHKTCYQNYLV